MQFLVIVLIILSINAYSFKITSSVKPFNVNSFTMKSDLFKSSNLLKNSPLALLIPSAALAEGVDSTPVLIPIVISLLTIVPFLYYQQALKPKPRTVKQIELDENLRPKDKKLNSGKASDAVAQKKK